MFNDLHMFNHLQNETTLTMIHNLFDVLSNSVCQYFLRIYAPKFTKEISL
jgi:hypothetical protein